MAWTCAAIFVLVIHFWWHIPCSLFFMLLMWVVVCSQMYFNTVSLSVSMSFCLCVYVCVCLKTRVCDTAAFLFRSFLLSDFGKELFYVSVCLSVSMCMSGTSWKLLSLHCITSCDCVRVCLSVFLQRAVSYVQVCLCVYSLPPSCLDGRRSQQRFKLKDSP